MNTSHTTRTDRGLTLAELLVTLTIFGLISVVLTTATFSLLGSRSQTIANQTIQDEFKNVLSSMEIEMAAADDFNNQDFCTPADPGHCTGFSFTLNSRRDLAAFGYRVTYKLDATGKKLLKGIQRNLGDCSSLEDGKIPERCFLPVTSENVEIDYANFLVEVPSVTSDRPLLTVVLQGHVTTDEGEQVPLDYSHTFSPGLSQNLSNVEGLDTLGPEIRLLGIAPAAGEFCSGLFVDRAMTIPYDNSPSEFSTAHNPLYTNCKKLDLSFEARDETGISGGRYDSDTFLLGGLCDGKACSEAPAETYSMPASGFFPGDAQVTFSYQNIPLKAGVGLPHPGFPEGATQKIHMKAKDTMGNPPGSKTLEIYQMSTRDEPTADGINPTIELTCLSVTNWEARIKAVPTNPLQYRVRWYRCKMASPTENCDPMLGTGMQSLVYRYNPISWSKKWFTERFASDCAAPKNTILNPGDDSNDAYPPVPCNQDEIGNSNLLDRGAYYRYAMTVVEAQTREESAPVLVRWTNHAVPGDDTIGYVPDEASFCTPGIPPVGPPTGDDDDDDDDATLTASVRGRWQVGVSGAHTGQNRTDSIIMTLVGNAYGPVVTIAGISPGTGRESDFRLAYYPFPTTVSGFPGSRSRPIFLWVPSDTPKGTYEVQLRVTSANAPDILVNVPLIVKDDIGGID
jgi:prepilin-type N-terminal cleavage/methylation domain-containing protein